MNKLETIAFIALLLLGLTGVGVIALLTMDGIASKKVPFTGIVVDKHYSLSTKNTGVGFGATTGGNGVIVTSSGSPEKYTLMVNDSTGVVSVRVNPSVYYSVDVGEPLECYKRKGTIIKLNWGVKCW